ncbi:MAG: hypothetical protein V9E94_21280 [Microthrixaceae bacterium]
MSDRIGPLGRDGGRSIERCRCPDSAAGARITVFLADDNLLVREGVRALLGDRVGPRGRGRGSGLRRAGRSGATLTAPQVVVTDIRMPPIVPGRGHRGGQGGPTSAIPERGW